MENQPIDAEVVPNDPINVALVEKQDEDPNLFWLSDSEKYALKYFRANFQKGEAHTFPLSVDSQIELFELYLNGRSLSEIRQANPKFSLGQIVDSAVVGDWQQKKQEYLETLLQNAKSRLQQISCESVRFLSDQMAVAHKIQGEKLQKYLQTGNEDDLGEFGIKNLRQYKEAAELLVRVTGQDKISTVNVQGEVKHSGNEAVGEISPKRTIKELAELKKAKERRK
jgi:hypothetical protein